MAASSVSPVVLVILDGWGYRENHSGNAIAVAQTPITDSLWAAYPHALIQTSGKAVGLPDGQMGNSEVGHLNLGAGRVVPQELVRISDAVEDGSILHNEALVNVCKSIKQRQKKLHLIGLCSQGGVHSHISHLFGLLQLAKEQGIEEVCIHAILDGRDTPPTSGKEEIQRLIAEISHCGCGRLVTLSGRYFAMDRDNRWERTQQAYGVMTQDSDSPTRNALEVIDAAYAQNLTDEFFPPTRIAPGSIDSGDGVIFFNFRPDRARQLTQVFLDPNFKGFEREPIQALGFVTFTQYDSRLPITVAFEPQSLDNILAQVISSHGLKQFRLAETEKYAHVTYFFNGGIEEPFPGEDRMLVPSPQVSTYDKAPAMSADAVTKEAMRAVGSGLYSLIVINYANPDMVGHTGDMNAAIQAVETVDECVGRLVASVGEAGGTLLITADHGNAEVMWDEHGNPWTAHTTNLVPFILIEGEHRKIPGHGTEVLLAEDGKLSDIAPTILQILNLPKPKEMSGQSLICDATVEARANNTPVRIRL